MADGERRTVLVPLATARKAARRAGVTLDLSAEDIALAGKWKHGWIPLDAVASAVKAKRYHGGGGEGRTVKGKGRAGSAVESRREPSRGRTKVKVGAPERASGPRREPHISAEPLKDGRHKLTDSKTGESVKAAHLASFHNQGHTITGVRNGQMHTRDDSGKAHVYDPATGRAATSLGNRNAGSMSAADRVKAAETMYGTGSKQHRKALATARAQQTAQDRTRRVEAARGEPKLADLSEADLQALIARYGDRSVQANAARAEMLRRSGGSATVSHPSITGQQVNPGDKVAFGKSGRDRWTVQRHLPAGKVHLQSEHLSSRGVGHGQATRTVDSSRLRHLSPPAGQSGEHPALSHDEKQTLSREQESLARANVIDRRSAAGKAGRLDETIKARERRIREIKRTLGKGAK